jgi:hypothetical protein
MAASSLADRFVYYALHHPRRIAWVMALSTVLIIALAAVPNFVRVPGLHPVTVDTDPENMLAEDEPVRVFHDRAKATFDLSDMVVVGIVNDRHPEGVFNPGSLEKIHRLTNFARNLSWPDPDNPGEREGVIEADMIAPSMVDNIEQGGLGEVTFSWLMATPPATQEEALAIRERALNIPFLNDTLVSGDGKAVALYLPLTSKDVSYRVRRELLDFTAGWQGDESVYITGLPVAEDTFGVEMFIQMAISAPLAMLVIFLLLWWFFKRLVMVVSPMLVAIVSALSTMGLLVISGNTIHIMSSMIPIFIMPIAVLDAVHILSEFFDRYPVHRDRRKTTEEVMRTLFKPMLFTTLTTMAGFASLALTPIPPVQVFGIFVAIGVFLAWLWTILFIPAYLMLIPESRLEGYGHEGSAGEEDHTPMGRSLAWLGNVTCARPRLILAGTLIIGALSGWGITLIQINDNPINWFDEDHAIRVADRVLNDHFGGTYMAYLSLKPGEADSDFDGGALLSELDRRRQDLVESGLPAQPFNRLEGKVREVASQSTDAASGLAALTRFAEEQMATAEGDAYFAWDEVMLMLDGIRQGSEVFKQPQTLAWMENLQKHLEGNERVGKVNSLPDIVKTVHRELLLGKPSEFRIPDSTNAVGQTLITYQNSHRPQDLWHFVTPDYRQASLWLQLTSGDNRDMEAVMADLEAFVADNPPPAGIEPEWFGLTYINVVWQDKMVRGMLGAFAGSFVVVLAMMVVLFRSVLFGLLSMIPLTFTVGLIYGIIGLIGKDYDMPVAILSALSLGLAVDYAIHFLARAREAVARAGDWRSAVPIVFGEPARAISRNAIVLSAGFLPLLAAPLVPYQTVGIFIATIILSAGVATLVILPALVTLLQRWLFK